MKRFEQPSGRRETITIETASPDETFRLGVMIGRSMSAGTALSLEGGLGAGKTLLVKGIVEGMGIKAEVLSPTFILVEEYRGEVPVFHFDLYRLEQFEEVEKIGFFDAIDHGWLVRFIEHLIGDQRVVRLIQKWLQAGVLVDGVQTWSETGTPRGGSASPLVANVHSYYVLDPWVEWARRRHAHGDVIVERFVKIFNGNHAT